MPLCTPDPIFLTDQERIRLQALVRQHKTPQQLATRARIILEADAGRGVSETAAALQVGRSLVQRWRRRWRERADQQVEQRLGSSIWPKSGLSHSCRKGA